MLKRQGQWMVLLIGIGDILVASAAWGLGYVLRYLGGQIGLTKFELPHFSEFVPAMVFSLVLTALIFSRFRLYAPKRLKSITTEIADLARAIVMVWVIAYFMTTLLRHVTVSRLMMVSVLASWTVLAILYRMLARMTLRRLRQRGRNLRHAAIVGTGRLAQRLYYLLTKNTWTGIKPHYFVADTTQRSELAGMKVYGPVQAVDDIIAVKPVDVVFVALPASRHEEVAQVLDRLAETNVEVRIVPDLLSFNFLGHDVSLLENLPIISMTFSPQHGWNSLLKRIFDILFSCVAIFLLAVPMLILAAIIKLTSKGPVFYRQLRTSIGGMPFPIFKFRTMIPKAEAKTGAVWAKKDDPRVTTIGRFLRHTSLDELPQLLNILVGQMSLVGPRPERPELVDRFRRQIPRYMLRSQVKAGLTGWAQAHGWRGQTSLRKRIQYDLYYITNWTFGLDLRIILLTLLRGFVSPNAY